MNNLKLFFSYLFCLILLINSNSYAQTNELPTARIDKLAKELIANKQTAGITILLIKNGKPFYNKAFGYADVEKKQPMRTDHIFRIASQTKAVTSLAAMMLFEEGKFLLDEPVSKYIPEFKNPKVLDKFNESDSSYTVIPAVREITIRDLFRHTSGISYPVISGNDKINAIYAKAAVGTGVGTVGVLKDKIILLAKQPLVHQPGQAFTYGLNSDVLGYLVEIWSGKSLNEFFRSRIFEPLEMTDTYFKLPKEKANRLVAFSVKDKNGNYTNSHTALFDGTTTDYPLKDGIYFSGGAGLVSTTADYAKFLQVFINKGKVNGKQLIGRKTLDLMLTNQLSADIEKHRSLQFGLGVGLVTPDNKYTQTISNGSFYWAGIFNTHYWADPKENIIGLVYNQEYGAFSEDIGHLFKNVVYSAIDSY